MVLIEPEKIFFPFLHKIGGRVTSPEKQHGRVLAADLWAFSDLLSTPRWPTPIFSLGLSFVVPHQLLLGEKRSP